jgi:hypothetical protein
MKEGRPTPPDEAPLSTRADCLRQDAAAAAATKRRTDRHLPVISCDAQRVASKCADIAGAACCRRF